MATCRVDDLVAAGYDAVYAAWTRSPYLHRIWAQYAAGDYGSPGFENLNFLTADELKRVIDELRVRPDDRVTDLACGAGGLTVHLAENVAARVVGIDVSRVGVDVATQHARKHSVTNATFVVGAAGVMPLSDASTAALVSIDALQYVPDKRAALRDVARVLRPSGRLVFTAFELEPASVAGLPVLGEDPTSDYSPLLEELGFRVDAYEETSGWQARVGAAYGAVRESAEALENEMGQAALAALMSEVSLTLEVKPYRRRIFAVATRAGRAS